MLFNNILGIKKINGKEVKINYREAVRAVILRNNNLLMVQTNKGDYKFPGGGIKNEEKHEETLQREVKEETGYLISKVKERMGIFTERNLDEFEEDSIFEMISYYYLCEVPENQTIQQLDDYEAELDFSPQWINIDAAISNNEDIIKNKNNDMNRWVYRETSVLKELKSIFS